MSAWRAISLLLAVICTLILGGCTGSAPPAPTDITLPADARQILGNAFIDEPAAGHLPSPASPDEARGLLDEGRYDDALFAYGFFEDMNFGGDLLEQIKDAASNDDPAKVVELCDAYLRLFPFDGYLDWSRTGDAWLTAAEFYEKNLPRVPEDELTPQQRRDLAALDDFRRVREFASEPRKSGFYPLRKDPAMREGVRRLADDLLVSSPHSRACAGALTMSAFSEYGFARYGERTQGVDDRAAAASATLGRLDELMRQAKSAGAPEETQRLLLYSVAAVWSSWGEGLYPRNRDALLQIARDATITAEQRNALLEAAQVALETYQDAPCKDAAALYALFLERHPRGHLADKARRNWIEAHLRADDPDVALATFRYLEWRYPEWDHQALPLIDIAWEYHREKLPRKALPVLDEAIRRNPASAATLRALRIKAACLGNLGDDRGKVAALKRAATIEATEDPDSAYTLDYERSDAIQSLAGHYCATGEWEQALHWFERWEPSTWCGTCATSMNSEKQYCIALCLAKLARAQSCLRAISQSFDDEAIVAVLVDRFHELGRSREILLILKDASLDPGTAWDAQTGLEYIRLLNAAERRDVETLWRAMQFDDEDFYPPDGWRREKTSELVAGLGESAKPFVKSKLESKVHDERFYALWTLARMKCPEVIPVVKSDLEHPMSDDDLRWSFRVLALLNTPEALDLIQHYIDHGTEEQRDAASLVDGGYVEEEEEMIW